jgi:hypothetical protein
VVEGEPFKMDWLGWSASMPSRRQSRP